VTLTPREVEGLLSRHGIDPRRGLGQNFVADPNTVRRIARLAGVGPGDRVVEIGPGLGSLTVALAEAGAEVVAVEADSRIIPVLTDVVAHRPGIDPQQVTVVPGDALTVDWDGLLEANPTSSEWPWVLVANLPYNVAATIVLHLLDEVPAISRMLVMVQREVGERLAAEPGTSAYGIPSVKLAYWARAEVVGRVPPTVFVPRPRVDSVLVAVHRRPEPATGADPGQLFTLVRTAFGQRRKMLRRSLAAVVPPEAFAAAGIDPSRRPEELGITEWGALADAMAPGADGGR
jgi:16S rRNA (adenine1518-N6/adenine1519-N6)-dimethyltransferase